MAIIHRLFEPRQVSAEPAAMPQPRVDEAPRAAPANPLSAELKSHVVGLWTELLQDFLREAPQTFSGIAEQCQNHAEQRRCYEASRVLRMEQSRFVRAFALEIGRRLLPAPAAAAPAVRHAFAQTMEETLLLAEIEVQIEGRHGALVADWTRRIEWMSSRMGVAASADACSAAGVVAALRAAVDALELPPEQRRLVYEVFDRAAVPRMEVLLRDSIAFLQARQIGESTWHANDAGVGAAAQDPLPGFDLDAATHAMLSKLAAAPSGEGVDDAALARELLAQCGRGDSVALQRLALCGQLLSGIIEDALTPDALKPVLEDLRFPVAKVALSDAGFFRNAAHPVRSLLGELATMGALSRIGSPQFLQQTAGLVRGVVGQLNLRASFVQHALKAEQRLTTPDVQRFLEQQVAMTQARHEDIVQRAHAAARQDVALRTLGRTVHDSAQLFLQQGWAPLMARRLLRHGPDSEAWRSAVARLEQVLSVLDSRVARQPLEKLGGLFGAITADLRNEGMPDGHIVQMLDALRAAYLAPAHPAEPKPRAAVASGPLSAGEIHAVLHDAATRATPAGFEGAPEKAALSQILRPGQWFRIGDAQTGKSRWLKVSVYYPRLDSVTFTEFDGSGLTRMRATALADDLVARRAEAINAGMEIRSALELLGLSRRRA